MIKFEFEKNWRRILLSAAAGILATILILPGNKEIPMMKAWWGTLYPSYCYSQLPDASQEEDENVKIQIKFRWLHGL